MGWISIIIGLILAGLIASAVPRAGRAARGPLVAAALLVFLVGVALSSMRYVSADRVGIVSKNAFGPSLSKGRIIATSGEMGVQAEVLYPGWKFWYWPVLYDVDLVPLTSIDEGHVGLVESVDGRPLSEGQVFADEMRLSEFERMITDPVYFLGEGRGQKGPQTSVLTPGQYRLNTRLFKVEQVAQTTVKPGTVAVLKSNVGDPPTTRLEVPGEEDEAVFLAAPGQKGVRQDPLPPGAYPLNPKAFEVHTVSTERRVANYTASERSGESLGAITVKSRDGFNFPVDVRVVYYIRDEDAPRVVALLGGDNQNLQHLLTSRVRSIFRDNAESVSALDYINQRSQQAEKSAEMLRRVMAPYGVSIESIDIGDVGGDDLELGKLLETQRLRKLAKEEELTFQAQQLAAEQEKQLRRIQQEAEEERRLATATYDVQIAEQQKQRQIIGAEAEAEAISIRAKAQADAFRQIAQQIGSGNAALLEILEIVGNNSINITPRVMVSNGSGKGEASGETTALIGTMLDTMIARDEQATRPAGGQSPE